MPSITYRYACELWKHCIKKTDGTSILEKKVNYIK